MGASGDDRLSDSNNSSIEIVQIKMRVSIMYRQVVVDILK